jgi:hypothetical protein
VGTIKDAVRNLRRALKTLEPFQDEQPIPPRKGKLYETFNGSVVYLLGIDDDDDGLVVVLKGGHRCSGSLGEKPGEQYYVDEEGYFRTDTPGVETVMSLRRILPVDLDSYGIAFDELTELDEEDLNERLGDDGADEND